MDADSFRGEVFIKIPSSYLLSLSPGQSLSLQIEFSLEDPRGGIHFVLPDGEGALDEVRAFEAESRKIENTSDLFLHRFGPVIPHLNHILF